MGADVQIRRRCGIVWPPGRKSVKGSPENASAYRTDAHRRNWLRVLVFCPTSGGCLTRVVKQVRRQPVDAPLVALMAVLVQPPLARLAREIQQLGAVALVLEQ